jgi:hypothetical protein
MQAVNRSRMIAWSMVGPATRDEPWPWLFSGEIDGLVTSLPDLGSTTRASRKNRAEPRISG